jgi:hypothetical protein
VTTEDGTAGGQAAAEAELTVTAPFTTVAEAQQLIVRRVGDIDPATGDLIDWSRAADGVIAQNMEALWNSHADKAFIPRLREAYVERDAFSLVIAVLGQLVDQSVESVSIKLGDRVVHLMERRDKLQTEIDTLFAASSKQRIPVAGPLLTTAPISAPDFRPVNPYGPDANDPSYGGSPYRRRRRGY